MKLKILVVGAGIAGSAIGCMLDRHGHDVNVVDAKAAPHTGGSQILVDRTALRIIHQIGASEIVHSLSTPTAFVNVIRHGHKIATLPMEGYRSARRGSLVSAISSHVSESVPFRYGREVVGIEQRAKNVIVHFHDGDHETYDLIIGADGLNSTVRQLAVDVSQTTTYENGRQNLWVNVPGRINGTKEAAILLGKGVAAQVFPYTDVDQTLVLTAFNVGRGRHDGNSLLPEVVNLLSSSGSEFTAFADRVRAGVDEPMHMTRFAQVRSRRWHARNIILVGDAAYCIDPLSGVGAHGALLGAAILTEEIQRIPYDIPRAAERYRRRLLPFVRSAQLLTAGFVEGSTARGMYQHAKAASSLLGAALSVRRVE